MQIPKASDPARGLFRALVPTDQRVEVKPMFGNLGAFVNGNMFMGVFGSDVGLKLPDADIQVLRAAGGEAFGPAQRPMGGYVSLPSGYTEARAEPWVRKSLDYVAALPPKTPKAKKAR